MFCNNGFDTMHVVCTDLLYVVCIGLLLSEFINELWMQNWVGLCFGKLETWIALYRQVLCYRFLETRIMGTKATMLTEDEIKWQWKTGITVIFCEYLCCPRYTNPDLHKKKFCSLGEFRRLAVSECSAI